MPGRALVLAALAVAVAVALPAAAAADDTAIDVPPPAPADRLDVPRDGAVPAVEPPPPAPPAPPSGGKVSLLRRVVRDDTTTDWAGRGQSLLGILALVALGVALSADRRRIPWRLVGAGLGLQLVFAVVILKTAPGRAFFAAMNDAIVGLLSFTQEGTDFLLRSFGTGRVESPLVNFAFGVLPTIVFFSSLMAVMYHLGFMQALVKGVAWVMQKTMRTSGAETLSAAGNIFLGQTESPLLVRPFLAKMTESELFCVMTGGMATVAGGVMAAYVGILKDTFPDIAGHLLAASVLSAPGALLFAKLMLPEAGTPETAGTLPRAPPKIDANVIDAAARGAGEGLHLALNVAAMLLAFIALIALLNAGIVRIGAAVGLQGLSFQQVAGWAFWPFAWIMGVPTAECATIGQLLGERTVLNEFVAYAHLGTMLTEGKVALSYRAVTVATYALCGFANFASIAIQIGGIGSLAPERRKDVARLGLRSVAAGTLASFLTASVAGLLL